MDVWRFWYFQNVWPKDCPTEPAKVVVESLGGSWHRTSHVEEKNDAELFCDDCG